MAVCWVKHAAFVASVLAAGCLGGQGGATGISEVSASAAAAQVSEERGGLEGLVINDEQLPIADATVILQDNGTRESELTVTAEDGRFSFSLLPPGRYHVAVQAPFYAPRSQDVEVGAGDLKVITFLLADFVDTSEPYVETLLKRGFINCSVRVYFAPQNVCGYVASDQAKFRIPINPELPIKSVVLEAVWTPSNPVAGQRLELAICHQKDQLEDPFNCKEVFGNYYFKGAVGPSPLVLHVNDLPLKIYPVLDSSVGAPSGATDPPLAFQQGFDLWMSMCYNEFCPEGFQGRPVEPGG